MKYHALVNINVPSDKARAVVDAMERDMGTTLATKQEFELLRRDMENRFALVDQRFNSFSQQLEQKIDAVCNDLSHDIAALDLKMTVKFGSMLFLGLGLTVAALRLWN